MGKPAARVTDKVSHPIPPVLTGGPGSPNVFIGNLPAWRGMPSAAVAALQQAKMASDAIIQSAETATKATVGTLAFPAAKAAENAAKTAALTAMSSTIRSSSGGADIHICMTPSPIPPHGPGIVIGGSKSVFINGLPACRMGDTLLEAIGPSNKILGGCKSVLIGD
ncbi:PAAR domain-containing protein [Limnoraphis robusta]|uniref:hypothetical protein n=1 Tax=Limnoraphis robusta TaxID=1118279 RepID=UPI002B20DC14|nr:hypothetical protein [Limnoraphis robusta]MEA5495941.1 hypothetical protein [Limnoraphis robusta BA-68 BA1]